MEILNCIVLVVSIRWIFYDVTMLIFHFSAAALNAKKSQSVSNEYHINPDKKEGFWMQAGLHISLAKWVNAAGSRALTVMQCGLGVSIFFICHY